MLRAVLDTNVIISGVITDHGAPFQILQRWKGGEFAVIISSSILQEIERVLHYPKIKRKRRLTEGNIRNVMELLRKYGIVTPADITIEAVPEDPADNKFVVAAVETEADYIVSGDRHLKDLSSYHGIRIVSPDEFLRVLDIGGEE